MNRQWLRSSVLLLCVTQLLAATRIVRADDVPAEKRLPQETLVFITVSDVPDLSKKWDKSTIGQLLQDPQVKPFMEDVYKKFDEHAKEVEDEIGVAVKDLLELPKGELSFALMEKPARRIAAVLMLEFGDNQATLDKLLKKMDEELDKDGAEHSTEDISNIQVHVYKLKQDDGSPLNELAYFTDKKMFVFSTELAALKDVIERWSGDSDDTLASNDQYKYIQQQCKPESGEALIKFFVNPIGLIQTGVSIAQESFPQAGMAVGILPLLGLDALKGYGGAMTMEDGDFDVIANVFMYADNSNGLMGLFNFPATQLTPPKWVPADVGAYSIVNWNILGAYTSVEKLIDQFQGRGATARMLDTVAENWPNIHPKKDVIDHLDGKMQLIQGESKELNGDGPVIPEMLFAFGLKDAAKMKKTISAWVKSSGGAIESREFNGETIYEYQPDNNMTFSVAVTEGQLIFTNDTPMLESIMRGQASRSSSLVDSPEYKRLSKMFPAKMSLASFQRTDVQLKGMYNTLKKMDPNDNPVEGIDLSKLPPFEVIAKYLQPSASFSVPDKKGVKSTSFTLKRND